ncbi:MAG: molybdate ABC transporter substrate-binding protein [Xanthomonadales bacterium]|jgi:molybdate transport system substrate-binding protein|nr:molybdate ABC transporter substrate-binding protein [Xanthomonadales bacterium]
MKPSFSSLIAALLLLLSPETSPCGEVRVAAASNFRDALEELSVEFEEQSAHDVVLIFGATGKHYAQVVHGAPFDVFFAADTARPERLEKEGLAVSGSRFTYAIGRLALWSTNADLVDPEGLAIGQGEYRHLAIANPELAPYGRAAKETLQSLGLWDTVSNHLVTGENIGQTFQFVASGNAELGLVAWSQLQGGGAGLGGSRWLVPDTLHRPIEQQAVLLKPGDAAESFLAFLRSAKAVEIIRAHGYGVPDDL